MQLKDVYLLPFLLPDIFEICKTLTNEEFAVVLPRVVPLFDQKDSPQTMLMLIDSIPMFMAKTSPDVFRKSESKRFVRVIDNIGIADIDYAILLRYHAFNLPFTGI